jgi:hypothetical protein
MSVAAAILAMFRLLFWLLKKSWFRHLIATVLSIWFGMGIGFSYHPAHADKHPWMHRLTRPVQWILGRRGDQAGDRQASAEPAAEVTR